MLQIFQQSQYELGWLWESNSISVAEEHMATAVTQFAMANTYPSIPLQPRPRGKVLITGVQGELHQLGANMVADTLEADGWDVRFLGTNLPHVGILQAVEQFQPDVIGITATMLFNFHKVTDLIGLLRSKLGAGSPKIVLGGSAFARCSRLAQEMGVLVHSGDVKSALKLMDSLVPDKTMSEWPNQ